MYMIYGRKRSTKEPSKSGGIGVAVISAAIVYVVVPMCLILITGIGIKIDEAKNKALNAEETQKEMVQEEGEQEEGPIVVYRLNDEIPLRKEPSKEAEKMTVNQKRIILLGIWYMKVKKVNICNG